MQSPLVQLLLLLAASGVGSLRVSFSLHSKSALIPIQDFGSASGSVNVSLTIEPTPCSATPDECWELLDRLTLAIFSRSQWIALGGRLVAWNGTYADVERVANLCEQPAMAWTSLSLRTWSEAIASPPASGTLIVTPAPATAVAREFFVQYALPASRDLYTLAIFNCQGSWLHASGEATFLGGHGEHLSFSSRDLLMTRLFLFALTLAAVAAYSLYVARHRTIAVPLHYLVVLVLFMRLLRDICLLVPQVMMWAGAVSPASGALPASTLEVAAAAESGTLEDGSDINTDSSSNWAISSEESDQLKRQRHMHLDVADTATSEWAVLQACTVSASALDQLGSLLFFVLLLAIGAGRHYFAPFTAQREKESLAFVSFLYFVFGMADDLCGDDTFCTLISLAAQVLKILIVFGVLLFFNTTNEAIRRAAGHAWPQLRADLLRLHLLKQLWRRALLAYLLLPVAFMFLEVVLEWDGGWFRLLWREGLVLYPIYFFAIRLRPSPAIFAIHFAHLRPSPGITPDDAPYAFFFRWVVAGGPLPPTWRRQQPQTARVS